MRCILTLVSILSLLWVTGISGWAEKKGKTTTPTEEKSKVTTKEKKSVSPESKSAAVLPQKKGGISPFLTSCFIGPRIGLELNEGKPVKRGEWLLLSWVAGLPFSVVGSFISGPLSGVVGPVGCCTAPIGCCIGSIGGVFSLTTLGARLYFGYLGFQSSGPIGGIASCCICPRAGIEYSHRDIRTMEWLTLIPLAGIIPTFMIAMEAYQGKTMIEIESKEKLKK